jgi:hypothetical protein
MKNMKQIAIGILLLLAVSGAAAQSLGDYARTARKNKPQSNSATRHFDNDNLPVNDTLSVVGPPPPAEPTTTAANTGAGATTNAGQAAGTGSPAPAAKANANDPAAVAAERQKVADDWKKKLEKQQEKISSISRELDLERREYRLRAAAMYADAGNRLRNAAQWDKDDAQYKSDVDGKQKALDAARQELDQMQEQARKAGIVEKDKDKDKE